MSLMERVDFAIKISRKAGKILLSEWGNPANISEKSSFQDLLTNMDKKSQSIIVEAIREKFPEDGVLAEEGIDERKSKMWVIDPIDGTVNYAFGLPSFSVSIAYVEDDQPKLGVIHLPVIDETYYAVHGSGAYMDGVRIKVSSRDELRKTVGLMGFFRGFTGKFISEMEDKVIRIRMLGSIAAGAAYIAAGRADFYVAKRANPWDVAAAVLILKEAGGRVTDIEGKEVGIYSKSYVFSNGKIHGELLKHIKDII
ncbi:MAG: inositol monophosphatase [Thermotogaceae bacterium]|nr:inositol monophosphatase [Thermotogaceae bacterium]